MPSQAALLIGDITHARKEWESLSSILTLKVRHITGSMICALLILAIGILPWE